MEEILSFLKIEYNLDDFEDDWSNWQGDEPLVLPLPTWPEVKQSFGLTMIPTKQAEANGR